MYKSLNKNTGFTIIELMITLAIAAILASIAAPSFSELIKNNRMTTQYNQLLGSLNLARSEAIKRANTVTICNSSPTCGGNWHSGWIVFVDENNDGNFDVGEETIRVHSALSGNNTLSFARDYITYGSDALATGFTGTFTLCDDRGDSNSKGLRVSNSGRVRHATASDTLVACP